MFTMILVALMVAGIVGTAGNAGRGTYRRRPILTYGQTNQWRLK